MKSIFVCTACGSPRVYADAWASLNNESDVRTFDDTHCDDCEGPCRTVEVQVDDDFDTYGDTFDLEKLK